jgi:hypothetical protein
MDDKKQELTPEEKLLALIQQGKQQDKPAASAAPVPPAVSPPPPAAAAPPAPATVSVVAVPPPARAVAEPVAVSKDVAPPSEKKIKLAAESPRPAIPVEPAKATAAESKKQESKPAAPAKSVGGVEPQVQSEKPGVAAVKTDPGAESSAPPALDPAARAGSPSRANVIPRTGGLVLVNRVLVFVVLVLLILVVYSIASIRSDVAAEIQKQIQVAGEIPMGSFVAANEAVPTLDSLIDKVGARNIFLGVTKGGSGGDANASSDKVEKSSDLKLMGVSVDSAEPGESIAIIKNKPDSKTYFVKIGQAVGETGYVLQRVLPDRVVLKGRKQEFELTGPSRSRSSN